MSKRKTISILVRVSIPRDMSASDGRREVRNLIRHGVGYFTNAGDDDGVKLKGCRGVRNA